MNPDRLQVKNIVRQRREELGMSIGDLARAVGIRSPEFVSLIEAGHSVIGLNRASVFAEALKLDVMGFCLCCLFEVSPVFYRAVFGEGEPFLPLPR
jgi:transcriptional regulator with XRE-family HTH domain